MPPQNEATVAAPALSTPLKLNAFLAHLTSKKCLSMSQAITAASSLYPSHASLDQLNSLTLSTLQAAGVEDASVRKGIMELIGKKKKVPKKVPVSVREGGKAKPKKTMPKSEPGVFEFDQIHYVEALMGRSVVINRSPVMTAWAFVVSERLGFTRRESLSFASVYTELNATSKGVSLGLLPASDNDPSTSNAQPHIILMGRKIPVMKVAEEWRGLSKAIVVEPEKAFGYLKRGFSQQLGSVIGAMQLLADAFPPDELNAKGYDFYCSFRPEVENGRAGWGERSGMDLKTILNLRPVVEEPKLEEEEEEDVKREEDVKDEEFDVDEKVKVED